MSARIAVVEDDEGHLELLSFLLQRAGLRVDPYLRPAQFLKDCAASPPEAAVIDVHLPGIDGRDVIRVLRANEQTRRMILVAISAVARSPEDAVRGFDVGADEYFTKPVDSELLVGRLQALLRRAPPMLSSAAPLRWDGVEVWVDEGRVAADGRDVVLTHQEVRLLAQFLRNPGRVLTRVMLLDGLWERRPGVGPRTVDKHVETLRRKLPAFGKHLETIVRLGYQFTP